LEAAIPVLERGVATVRATDSNGWKHVLVGALGTAYGHAGRFAEGLALLEEAERNVVDRGFPTFQAICAGDLSAVYVLAGRPDVAWPHACRALDLARQVKACALEARALFELGIVLTHADSPDVQQGETTYREALALAEPRGMRPLIAHCHHGLGTLYRRTGTRQQAEEHLTIARTMYREMDMTYWLEQAGREVGA
jgi:tetratricopeptide (TPR) repeat protein